ncbi:sugar ABC transporter substrate-binding protein [Paenibacillus thiaminolyticus]|uniref:ABC transporter substrate-binding protein n=1 Tax=Paenibacillus thiaminolyticus TaxID=49283 RepID=UPI003D2929F7
MKQRRITILLLVFAMVTMLISACGTSTGEQGASGSAGAAESGQPGEKVKLKVATWAGASELKEFEELISQLNEASSEYTIEVQSIPADYYQKLQAMIAGKQAPDFMWLSQEYVAQYAKLGAIKPLDEELAKTDFNRDDYFQGALDVGINQGQIYALPWISQPYVLYYNQDMFEEAGIDLPNENWTWDDFIYTGKKLTKDGQWGGLIYNMPLPMFLWSYGGDVFDKDGNITLNSAQAMQGLEMYQKIAKSGVLPERAQADSMGGADMFKTGKVAMFVGGAGDDFEKTATFNVGMTLAPKGTEQVTFSWIGVTAMSKTTKNPEIAAKALQDMTKAMHNWKVVAPTKSSFDAISTIRSDKDYAVDTIRKASEFARGFNNQPQQAEIDGVIWEKLIQPLEKGEDVSQAVDATIARLHDIIKK